MTFSGNNVQSTATVMLYSLQHQAFTNGAIRFQLFQQQPYRLGRYDYPFRDWVAPIALDSTTQNTNRSQVMVIRRTDRRQEPLLPTLDLARAYDGLTSAIVRALRYDTRVERVFEYTYQVRTTMLSAGDIVFQLQAAGFDSDWPTIGGLTANYQNI